MSQSEVLQVLKNNKGEWMTSKQISAEIGVGKVNVGINMGKLAKKTHIYPIEFKPTVRKYFEPLYIRYIGD